MKRFLNFSIILTTLLCCNLFPLTAKGASKVYYVVVGSHSTLDRAIQQAKSWQGNQPKIYKGVANGKTVYRLCPASFSTNAKAKNYIASRGLDAWVWPSAGAASCMWSPSGSGSSYASSNSSSYSSKSTSSSTSTSWLRGTWIIYIDGGAYMKVKIINDTQLIDYIYLPSRGEMDFARTYRISGNKIIVSSGGTYYIDQERKLLLSADGRPFSRL